MMHRKKTIWMLLLVVVVAMTGCSQGKGEGADVDTEDQKKEITVALDWTPNTNHTGMYVALEKGYYQEAGLDVTLVQPPEGGSLSMAAAGGAQFAVTFQEEIAAALTSETPLPVVAVAALVEHNDSGLVSAKEKGILSPRDMEGKKYASWDTPIEHAILSHIVSMDGGDPAKVNFIPNTVTDAVSALQTDTDLIWIYYSWDGIATELAGLETNYIELRSIDPVLDFYTPVLAAGEKFLTEDQETAKAFLAATQKGYQDAIHDPAGAAEILLKHAPELDAELVQASQAYLSPRYQAEKTTWGTIEEGRWKAFYDWMYENDLIPVELGSKGFTNDYLPE